MTVDIDILPFPAFTICLILKVASTAMTDWDSGIKARRICADQIDFDKPVYALWKPAYDRILSGLHTEFNVLAFKNGGDAYRIEHYRQQFDKWNLAYLTVPRFPGEHCRLLQDIFQSNINNISFIHISQIGILHLYLNRTYNLTLPALAERVKAKEVPGDGPNKLPFSSLTDILIDHPVVYSKIAHYAAQDYIPEQFININRKIA